MTGASCLSSSLVSHVLSVHFKHHVGDLKHVDSHSGRSVSACLFPPRTPLVHWSVSDILWALCCPLPMKPYEMTIFSIFISFRGIFLFSQDLWSQRTTLSLYQPLLNYSTIQGCLSGLYIPVYITIFYISIPIGSGPELMPHSKPN